MTRLVGSEMCIRDRVWEVVEQWLKTQPNGRIKPRQLNAPKITGGLPNPGYVA
jgi:sulfur-oxidizing protein SoxB